MLIDSHAHLVDPAFDTDRDAVLARAREAGIAAIVNVGYDEARWATTLALSAAHREVYAALGLHPHEATAWDEALAGWLRAALAAPKVVALGEIGLDYYRDWAPRDRQRELFERQLALAQQFRQRLLGPAPLDALRDDVRHRRERFERVVGECAAREHSQHADQPVPDEQRVARERHHPLAPRPLLVAHARVADHRVRQVRSALGRDEPYLEPAHGHPPVRAVRVRVHPRARL